MNGTCETGVCAGVIAHGSATGDVTGLGYCNDCELSAQDGEYDDDLLAELLFEDGLS